MTSMTKTTRPTVRERLRWEPDGDGGHDALVGDELMAAVWPSGLWGWAWRVYRPYLRDGKTMLKWTAKRAAEKALREMESDHAKD